MVDEGLKQVVVPGAAGAAGWDYVNEGTAEKPKWGYIASQPGSVLQLQLDVAAGEWTQGPGLKVLGLRVRASGSGPQGSGVKRSDSNTIHESAPTHEGGECLNPDPRL